MRANELLLWMSARRAGSWQQFRAAVEELHSPEDGSESNDAGSPASDEFQLYQRLRLDFGSLGHAEFFARECEHGWRIAPPALATHPVPNGFRAVLCGARSPALLDRLRRAGEPFAAEVLSNLVVPDVVRFTDPDIGSLESLAIQSGIRFQPDAPLAILYHLPPCVPPTRQHPQSPFPEGAGWRIREFDPSAVRWRGVSASTCMPVAQVCLSSSFTTSGDTSSAGLAEPTRCRVRWRFTCSFGATVGGYSDTTRQHAH